jgi:hypothetical protein
MKVKKKILIIGTIKMITIYPSMKRMMASTNLVACSKSEASLLAKFNSPLNLIK